MKICLNHNVTVRRGYVGNETLKIGELAEMANVTKRTVDYYTNLGLLKAERSASNYRYYSVGELERLRRIEGYKRENLSLEDIKEILKKDKEAASAIEAKGLQLKNKMDGLNEELQEFISLIEKDGKSELLLKKQISRESMALIQSLLVLLV
ncbi:MULTISPECIES: MerR family transcriptional regulator [Peribacillus]|jgi:MerR family transcriptional regulator, copper efflux regulator|uniref:MerR family transcriptional regulator n=1 Tax=Peribacillus TaxID=2675229 RepID=UPI00119BA707|nr:MULTISPECIES: MerR family transcriptional regulator [Peribacillus]MDP9743392.1 MerR family copper efflux transcriptional regulator [Bacillus sp. B2I3]MCU6603984.1 MerR family transcriptional regulator [Peribacillus frigoritolerans]MCY9006636.1 MerR family transcriptional regulator [Peribacillus frigoritolerans]MCZ0875117.1 MerR family transcriptional regulator [Peribacillus sp. AS_2]MDG4847643.1 MerR family transcriptional regulator [Peribacillus frigoritolerans]